jgi:hypothetical protein
MKKFLFLVILSSLVSCGGSGTSTTTNQSGVNPVVQYASTNHSIPQFNEDGSVTEGGTAEIVLSGVTKSTVLGDLNKPINPNLYIISYKGNWGPFVNSQTFYFLVDVSGFTKTEYTANDILKYIIFSPQITYDFDSNLKFGFTDGTNFYYSAENESQKDVEQIGAKIESASVESLKQNLLSYGLSVERTEKLAKLMVSYKNISNKRALNAVEKDQFTKEILGMSFENAAKKMVENYDGLIETAAEKNGTSPEAVKELVNELLSK